MTLRRMLSVPPDPGLTPVAAQGQSSSGASDCTITLASLEQVKSGMDLAKSKRSLAWHQRFQLHRCRRSHRGLHLVRRCLTRLPQFTGC